MKGLKQYNHIHNGLVVTIVFAGSALLISSVVLFLALVHSGLANQKILLLSVIVNYGMVVSLTVSLAFCVKLCKKLYNCALYDNLTGLPNRNYVQNYLKNKVSRTGVFFALMSLDMDNFKEINDSLGHLAGDQLLKEASCRLKNVIGFSDYICRISGDEFVFFINSSQGREKIERLAYEILNVFKTPFQIDGNNVECITASLGIALIPQDGADYEALYKNADKAMYNAKKSGKNQWRFYDQTHNPSS